MVEDTITAHECIASLWVSKGFGSRYRAATHEFGSKIGDHLQPRNTQLLKKYSVHAIIIETLLILYSLEPNGEKHMPCIHTSILSQYAGKLDRCHQLDV